MRFDMWLLRYGVDSWKMGKNTAAKQLPSWLHPAVPTIRRYSKMVQQTKGNHPSLYYVPLFSYQAIVIIIGVRTFQLILLNYTYKYRKKQFRKISFSILTLKKDCYPVRIAILFWCAWHDSNVWPTESEAVCQGFSETPDGVYFFRKKPVI